MTMDGDVDRVAASVSGIVQALLVAGRKGAPAEGRLPFNPLYFHMLRHLRSHGPSRPSDIADGLGASRTTLSTAAKALSGRGLLGRVPDPNDGRAHMLTLTAEGEAAVDAILRQDRRNAEAMLESLVDPEERAVFVTALEKVAAGLTPENDEGAAHRRPLRDTDDRTITR
ncbi:MAG: MarR family winged helix-turn-helix transcriptional regulator [Pseudomonadota bacterium]